MVILRCGMFVSLPILYYSNLFLVLQQNLYKNHPLRVCASMSFFCRSIELLRGPLLDTSTVFVALALGILGNLVAPSLDSTVVSCLYYSLVFSYISCTSDAIFTLCCFIFGLNTLVFIRRRLDNSFPFHHSYTSLKNQGSYHWIQ